MTQRHVFRALRLSGIAVIALSLTSAPSLAQVVVYDPSNYAQNVLQAARALEQVTHQITGLQNQTQMLLNQARNLTSLPLFLPAGHPAIVYPNAATAQSGPASLVRRRPD